MSTNDTIAAISTPLGEGGIGVVRISGKQAFSVAEEMFVPHAEKRLADSDSHTAHHGYIAAPGTGEMVDEVLVTVMRSPKTYTAEDVVEISCHGGIVPMKNILGLCLSGGARLAEPGEFTKRAFLNGRMDLAQAEAVLDIICSQTDASRKVAVQQLKGALSKEVMSLRSEVLEVLSLIEASIDFSQEDIDLPEAEKVSSRVGATLSRITEMLKTSEKGMMMREGASIVICGRPNVGKSSLMNALLRHDRVIVTPVAGTTRDVIEESIILSGVKVKVSDTAGIIETSDRVELEGIRRSREKLDTADIVIFVLDLSRDLTERDEEVFRTLEDKKIVIVANKADLDQAFDLTDASKRFSGRGILKISALKKEGLESIEDAVAKELFDGEPEVPEGVMVTNMRHKDNLEKAAECLERAADVTGKGYKPELLASDLKEAVDNLGLITGETVEDDILDKIFSQFCIGK
ncbi:MAG: tRNA uridine-5-carboxymethylaminomethyl(34) synthesis GTPase MnmE [Candidatus Tantalella remota]|nr:tRNA uridine-5-carboxymethylaminomethyl(34) synthesis GTPase MnmE [Candidatus Tantalella remota]